jgi:hypothetical protein
MKEYVEYHTKYDKGLEVECFYIFYFNDNGRKCEYRVDANGKDEGMCKEIAYKRLRDGMLEKNG